MEPREVPDAELVTALAQGDLAALRQLYDRHAAWLSVRLSRRCSDPDAVADALQDCFVAVWKESGRWRGDGEVAAWLWGIAVRRLISRLRAGDRTLARLTVRPPTLPSRRGLPPSRAERRGAGPPRHRVRRSRRRPGRLSPEMRAVVEATVLDGLTSKEAGRLLGIPQNTVKTRLHRAKAQLRQDLAGGIP